MTIQERINAGILSEGAVVRYYRHTDEATQLPYIFRVIGVGDYIGSPYNIVNYTHTNFLKTYCVFLQELYGERRLIAIPYDQFFAELTPGEKANTDQEYVFELVRL